MSTDKMKNLLRKTIMTLYETKGFEVAKNKATEFLMESFESSKEVNNVQAGSILRGELAEIFLEIHLREYTKRNPGTFYVKGLTIERTDGKDGFTELDVTLFRKDCIILFECKSYAGKKKLINTCTIKTKDKEFNVFGQNKMHLDNLVAYVDRFATKKMRPRYKLVLFTFADEEVKDTRTAESKEKMPHITRDNLMNFLNQKHSEELWDTKGLWSLVKGLHAKSEANFKKHLKSKQS